VTVDGGCRAWVTAVFAVACVFVACAGPRAPSRPDEACAAACERRIPRCGATACARGCQLALDRLVEHEGPAVLACVAASPAACDDWLWADCAAHVGPHADGGPPPPPDTPRH
jgi:hypothetical protein